MAIEVGSEVPLSQVPDNAVFSVHIDTGAINYYQLCINEIWRVGYTNILAPARVRYDDRGGMVNCEDYMVRTWRPTKVDINSSLNPDNKLRVKILSLLERPLEYQQQAWGGVGVGNFPHNPELDPQPPQKPVSVDRLNGFVAQFNATH